MLQPHSSCLPDRQRNCYFTLLSQDISKSPLGLPRLQRFRSQPANEIYAYGTWNNYIGLSKCSKIFHVWVASNNEFNREFQKWFPFAKHNAFSFKRKRVRIVKYATDWVWFFRVLKIKMLLQKQCICTSLFLSIKLKVPALKLEVTI